MSRFVVFRFLFSDVYVLNCCFPTLVFSIGVFQYVFCVYSPTCTFPTNFRRCIFSDLFSFFWFVFADLYCFELSVQFEIFQGVFVLLYLLICIISICIFRFYFTDCICSMLIYRLFNTLLICSTHTKTRLIKCCVWDFFTSCIIFCNVSSPT